MPKQKSTWTYVPSNADDEVEVFDLPQTPNRPQSVIYSHGTNDSMTANAVIRLLDVDRNQGIMDDGQEVVVNGLRKTVVLWDHQKAGVAWMRQREQGGKGGGIVADEMGQVVPFLLTVLSCSSSPSLGKTILGITRILDGRPSSDDQARGWARATL